MTMKYALCIFKKEGNKEGGKNRNGRWGGKGERKNGKRRKLNI